MRRTVFFVLLPALLAGLFVSVADAQRRRRGGDEPTAEQRQTAREAYARGQQLFREGDFPGAEAAFQQAFEAIPNPVVLLGLAEVRERAGNARGAVDVLERYIQLREDAPDREQVEGRIAAMRARPATLVITSTPSDAAITIDGSPREERTPAEIEVPPGEHRISIVLDGHEEATATLEATFGTRHEVGLELEESESVDDPLGEGEGDPIEDDLPPDDTADEGGDLPAGVWIASALAGIGLVGGTVLGFLALSEQADFDENPTEAIADDGERFALFADVAFGVAAVAGITAIVLYVTADEPLEEEEEDVSVSVAPALGPNGGGMAARLRF